MKDQHAYGDALPIPTVYIKKLEDRVKELEAENKRLKKQSVDASWKEDFWREEHLKNTINRGGHGW